VIKPVRGTVVIAPGTSRFAKRISRTRFFATLVMNALLVIAVFEMFTFLRYRGVTFFDGT
jgi:hypothetical protein